MASRVAVHRRLAARVLTRGMARRIGAELERVLIDGVCSRCGSWRCPFCESLIVVAADHHYACPKFRGYPREAER